MAHSTTTASIRRVIHKRQVDYAILSYNLMAPGSMQLRGLRVDQILADVEREIPSLDDAAFAPDAAASPPPDTPASRSRRRRAWQIMYGFVKTALQGGDRRTIALSRQECRTLAG